MAYTKKVPRVVQTANQLHITTPGGSPYNVEANEYLVIFVPDANQEPMYHEQIARMAITQQDGTPLFAPSETCKVGEPLTIRCRLWDAVDNQYINPKSGDSGLIYIMNSNFQYPTNPNLYLTVNKINTPLPEVWNEVRFLKAGMYYIRAFLQYSDREGVAGVDSKLITVVD